MGVGRERLPKMFHQFAVKGADFGRRNRCLILERVTTTEIHGGGHQALVHRQREMPVTINAGAVTQRFVDSLAQGDADVFASVVVVDVQITHRADVQIDQRMLCLLYTSDAADDTSEVLISVGAG